MRGTMTVGKLYSRTGTASVDIIYRCEKYLPPIEDDKWGHFILSQITPYPGTRIIEIDNEFDLSKYTEL